MRRIYKSDCRHFVGDRPCTFHKVSGITCGSCTHYDPAGTRILIVKLGAMGDVLRTTSLLPTLGGLYERPRVTWLTLRESLPLFDHHPLVDEVMACGSTALARLQVERFDLLINPEASRESSALATLASAGVKKGFGLSATGAVYPFNPGAEEIFPLGLFDDLKRENQRTYEELICRLAEIPYLRTPPRMALLPAEVAAARHTLEKTGLGCDGPVVGINTGGGGRWRLKRWTTQGFTALARDLNLRLGARVVLLGGPGEAALNRRLAQTLGAAAVDAGCDNPLRHFAAIIACCDLLVTGDSLALHLGLAADVRVVALFGPTSAAEIDLYGRGEKISSDLDCLCCYRPTCERVPNCMQAIPVDTVSRAVERQIACL